MKKQRQRSGVRTMLCMSGGLATLLLLTGCGEEKAKPVAQNAAPSTTAQTTTPAVSGAGTATPDPHPWIGNKPPPGSAVPPGGPKIPQK